MKLVEPIHIPLIILYLMLIFLAYFIYARRKYNQEPQLIKFMMWGIFVKLLGGIAYGVIIQLVYNGEGDSFYYFRSACFFGDLLYESPYTYFRYLINFYDKTFSLNHLGCYYPDFRDPTKTTLHAYLSLFTIAGLKNYYLTTLCLNACLFMINWKVFLFVRSLFPSKTTIIAISFLFIPSVIYWSGGLIKDPFTYSFSGLFLYYFYKLFIKKTPGFSAVVWLFLSGYIVFSLKPYILYSMLIAGFIWVAFSYARKVENRIIRVFILPVLLSIFGIAAFLSLGVLGNIQGGWYQDIDSMITKAEAASSDLKQEHYQGFAFNIGDYEPTLTGALSVSPKATVAGLYRPYIWEARSIVTLMSGMENFILLLLSFYALFHLRFTLKEIGKSPFLVFCLVFSVIFAFGIGLSTSNFGALVRFKIPMLPYFTFFLLFIFSESRKHIREKKKATPLKNFPNEYLQG